jgi:hypothetical protein
MAATLLARNVKEAVVGWGPAATAFCKVWSQADGFMLVRLAGNLTSVAVTKFPHLIYFATKRCIFNMICKDNG